MLLETVDSEVKSRCRKKPSSVSVSSRVDLVRLITAFGIRARHRLRVVSEIKLNSGGSSLKGNGATQRFFFGRKIKSLLRV